MDGLLFVLSEWEPAEPMGKDLVDIDTFWSKPHHLSNSRDAVLRGVDVFFRARLRRLNDADEQRKGLCRKTRTRVQYQGNDRSRQQYKQWILLVQKGL